MALLLALIISFQVQVQDYPDIPQQGSYGRITKLEPEAKQKLLATFWFKYYVRVFPC